MCVCVPLSKLSAYDENECITLELKQSQLVYACVLFTICSAIQQASKRSSHAANKRWTERKSPFATLATNIVHAYAVCFVRKNEPITENSVRIHVERPLLCFSYTATKFVCLLLFCAFIISLSLSLARFDYYYDCWVHSAKAHLRELLMKMGFIMVNWEWYWVIRRKKD